VLAAVRLNYDFFHLKIIQYHVKKFRQISLLPKKKLNLLILLAGDTLLPCWVHW